MSFRNTVLALTFFAGCSVTHERFSQAPAQLDFEQTSDDSFPKYPKVNYTEKHVVPFDLGCGPMTFEWVFYQSGDDVKTTLGIFYGYPKRTTSGDFEFESVKKLDTYHDIPTNIEVLGDQTKHAIIVDFGDEHRWIYVEECKAKGTRI